MMFNTIKMGAAAAAVFVTAGLLMLAGCGQQSGNRGTDGGPVKATEASHENHEHAGDDHSGWWCAEHGIPEEKCSLCSSKAAAAFKAKGDWCEKHNRAASQCFKCDPSRAEKFTKLFAAKFGKQPPKPTE